MVRRRQRIRFDALAEDAAERLASREPSPAQQFSDTHFDADIQQALDTLAPEFRAAVVLCDIEGLSYEEIAATLGVKLGTVRSRIHRAARTCAPRSSTARRARRPGACAVVAPSSSSRRPLSRRSASRAPVRRVGADGGGRERLRPVGQGIRVGSGGRQGGGQGRRGSGRGGGRPAGRLRAAADRGAPAGALGARRGAPLGERLTAYLDGELGHDARERVQAHLATCAQCLAEADEARGIKQLLTRTEPTGPSALLMSRLLAVAALPDEADGPGPAGSRCPRPRSAAAG